MIHWTVLNVNEKSIRNLNEKPAQLFIGNTIEKTGLDTLINISASGHVFGVIVSFAYIYHVYFQQISMTNLRP